MAMYLNSLDAFVLYKSQVESPYFVDKTKLLSQLFPLISQGNKHICITRPRRFGKTVMANMIGAFFGKGADASELFESLDIAHMEGYQENINKYDVITIDFSQMPEQCRTYDSYIMRISNHLKKDLARVYPEIDKTDALWDILKEISESHEGQKFIFVLDEWDAVFHMPFVTEDDKRSFLMFLKNLLKDKPYVSLAYMTGILPIAKYASGSELNMFMEYTMVTEAKFSDDFGFTHTEVDMLFQNYLANTQYPQVTRDGLKLWYDGYHTKTGERMYNPRSVVAALTNNNLGNYWTNSGPYDEIFYYINKNVADVCKDLALMAAGEEVPATIREYAATAMDLSTREEIFSAMVVYGFLSYENGRICIPNKELMDKFNEMIRKESSLGYVNRLAKESERMLQATLAGDTDTMKEILEYAHNTEAPILSYNKETELSAIVNLVYLAARDKYRVEREDKAGGGYVDFIFYPERREADALILELKVDSTPEDAIQQIKDKNYALRFKGKLGEMPKYTGRILAAGISYNKKTKKHSCRVEEI